MTDKDWQARLVERLNRTPMMATLNQSLVEIEVGRVVIATEPDQRFENSMARMHGGFVAALIDTALGWCVSTKLKDNVGFGTVDLNVKFIRKVDISTGTLFATALIVHAGRTMLTAEAKVADATGKLYAHGSGTFLVYPT
jgi:acyl-CoA thioesterase